MGRDYYYLVASLPHVSFDAPPPITPAELLRMGEGQLSSTDSSDLRSIVEGHQEEVDNPAFRGYVARDTQMRVALARLRAARAGADASEHQHPFAGFDRDVERVAAEAMTLPDPLQRELALDRYRFWMLEGLSLPSSFDSIVVLSYAARLLIVERRFTFDAARGTALLRRILDEAVMGVTL